MTKKLKSGTPFVYDENDRVVGIRDPHTGTDTDLVTAVTSPGGGVVLAGTAARSVRENRGGAALVLFGHSYMDQNISLGTMGRSYLNSHGEMVWVNFLLDSPLDWVSEEGIGGERIADALSRVARVAALRPTVVAMSIGTNDLKNTRNEGLRFDGYAYEPDPSQTSLEVCKTRAAELLERLIETGAEMILVFGESSSVSPSPGMNVQLIARTKRYNEYLRYYCRNRGGPLRYVPVEQAMTDPNSMAGDQRTGAYTDTIHPSVKGAYARAEVVVKQVGAEIKSRFGVERLIDWAGDTFANLKVVGTSIVSDGNTLTVTLPNGSTSYPLLRSGDLVVLNVPDAAAKVLGGKFFVLSHSDTQVVLSGSRPVMSFSGTINVSNAKNMFDNPLFITTTGGTKTGGGTLVGTLPAGVTMQFNAGTVTVTYEPHTDRAGAVTGFGNWMVLDCALDANRSVLLTFDAHTSNEARAEYGRFWPGDAIGMSAEIEVLAANELAMMASGLRISATDGTTTLNSAAHTVLTRTITDPHPQALVRGVSMVPEWQSPNTPGSAITEIKGQLALMSGATGYNFKLRIARLSIYREDYPVRDLTQPIALTIR